MKITGPKPGQPAPGTGDASEVGRSGGPSFADKLDKPDAIAAPKGQPKTETSKNARVSDIAQALEAGQITPEAALDRVLDRVLDNQLGANAPATLRSKVETAMRDAMTDPVLAEKIKRLG
jgi:hypothetical protein